jgi:hypothetical protein
MAEKTLQWLQRRDYTPRRSTNKQFDDISRRFLRVLREG